MHKEWPGKVEGGETPGPAEVREGAKSISMESSRPEKQQE